MDLGNICDIIVMMNLSGGGGGCLEVNLDKLTEIW